MQLSLSFPLSDFPFLETSQLTKDTIKNEWVLSFHTHRVTRLWAADSGTDMFYSHTNFLRTHKTLSALDWATVTISSCISVWDFSRTILTLQPLRLVVYRSASRTEGILLGMDAIHSGYKKVRLVSSHSVTRVGLFSLACSVGGHSLLKIWREFDLQ